MRDLNNKIIKVALSAQESLEHLLRKILKHQQILVSIILTIQLVDYLVTH
jgi:hypothetical protein